LGFTIDMSQLNGLATDTSSLSTSQDGNNASELQSYGIGNDGTITGVYANGITHTLGQVAIAVFPNEDGLVAGPNNLWGPGPNAGTPNVTSAGQFGAGSVLGGALELSNVDLSNEFIGLITSSTGFQAASRVISTSNDMLDQLLLITR